MAADRIIIIVKMLQPTQQKVITPFSGDEWHPSSLSLYFCVLTISLSMSPFYIYHFPAFKTFSLLKCNQGLMLNMFYTKDKMIGAAVKLWSLLKSPAMY